MKLNKEQLRAIKSFAKYNFWNLQDRNDFVQYASERIMQGRRSKLRYLYVDFLRETWGNKKRKNFEEKNNVQKMLSLEIYKKEVQSPQIDTTVQDFINNNYESFNSIERLFYILVLKWGFELREIAELLAISPSRCSQICEGLLTKVKDKRFIV